VQGHRTIGWPKLLAACALAYLVCVAFFPIVGFEFIESDAVSQAVHNPHIRGLTGENLKHIFTSRCITSFYPVRTLTYAIDYQFWGLNAAGFKLTNGLIHLANTLLVFLLILRLLRDWAPAGRSPKAWADACVATFATGVFAVHPVVVEPVAWVAGREELLMTLGTLGCFHFHLTARRLSQGGSKTRWTLACHVAAAFCCTVACFSNAVAAMIPLLIVAWDMLTLEGPRLRRILYGTSPLWAIGMLSVVIKGLGHEAALAREVGAFSAQRLMLVLNVYWLNLTTLVWPTSLSLSYGRLRPDSFLDPEVILGGIALGLTCAVLWKLRRRKLVLFGTLWFGFALGPTSQIMPHHIHRADRFLYLPLVGLAIALGVGLRPLGNVVKPRLALAGVIVAGISCLLVLNTLSVYQVQTWRNDVSLWKQCVTADPKNPVTHRALADSLAKRGDLDQAIPHYKIALQMEPAYIDALRNFAFYLVTCKNESVRDDGLAVELAERGCELTGWKDRDFLRTLAIAYTNIAIASVGNAQFQSAVQNYDKAIEADPVYEVALFNQALLLATCTDDQLREPERAVRLAERACQLIEEPGAVRLSVLAATYAAVTRFGEAVTATQRALQVARTAGNRGLTEELQRQLELYQNRSPYRGPP